MQFRVRPSSKKSSNHEVSLVEFPTSKSLRHPDSPLPRTAAARIDKLEASLSAFQEMYKRDRQLSNAGYVESQKRLDKIQYKMFSVEQDLRQLSEIRELKPHREIVPQLNGGESSKSELMLMKQVLLQEKQSQRELTKHQNSQIEQLSLKLLRQEQEMRQMIAQQRIHWEQRLSGQQEEIRQVQGLKNRKMEQQYEMMKGVIANAERKIFQELERKIRNEAIIKDFVEDRLAEVKEELGSEHRQTLVSETKFIKQTKQSLETLFSITNSIKKELSENLEQTQKLTTGSIKKLAMAIDIYREKAAAEIKQLTELNNQTTSELTDLRNFVTSKLEENRQIMTDFEEHTLDKVYHGDQSTPRNQPTVDQQRFTLLQKQIQQWKSLTQQKNLNVFKEISNTLKAMKLQWRKQNDELVSEVAALNQSLKSIKKSGPNELKKNVQALVSIFNNQFDVLAEQLETLTDMIALAKKQNEKTFKEDLNRLKTEIYEEIKNAVSQKAKECNLYTDKTAGRTEEHMKTYVAKEIRFSFESLSQRIDKNEALASQLQTSIKKMNLLTASQLEEYSIKLKDFNDNYKDYLEEQRKEDMKKRMELEENMRKNASNLMDVCYKKSQFLVEGLKNTIEVSQMKEKVQAAQALDAAKDQLRKEVQGARIQWQKQLSQGLEKITKEREASQQMLQQTIEQSINNTKRTLSNEIGNAKLDTDEKINELNRKAQEREKEQQDKQIDLKNTVLQMLRDEKKLTQEKMQSNKQQVLNSITALEQKIKQKDIQDKNRQSADKKDIEALISSEVAKIDSVHKQQLTQTKASLQQAIAQNRAEINLKIVKLEQKSAKTAEEQAKTDLDSKSREAELQKKMQGDIVAMDGKIKEISVKVEEINKKIGQNQVKAQKQKSTTQNQTQEKQTELQKKITVLIQDLQLKNKTTGQKIEEVSRKIDEFRVTAEKKEGEGKQVGESSLNKVKTDLEKEIQNLSARVEELQSHDKGEQNEQAIGAIRKSVNKLEAMVFSQQAKNKAMFDRLTEDINKVTENVSLLTNQMMQ